MAVRSLFREAPYKSAVLEKSGRVALGWLSWLNGIAEANRVLAAEFALDPTSLGAGAASYVSVSVPGTRAGDIAAAAFTPLTAGILCAANVTAADTVTILFLNATAGTVDLPAGTLRVRVEAWR